MCQTEKLPLWLIGKKVIENNERHFTTKGVSCRLPVDAAVETSGYYDNSSTTMEEQEVSTR